MNYPLRFLPAKLGLWITMAIGSTLSLYTPFADAQRIPVSFSVTDETGAPLPARIHLQDESGKAWHTEIERAAPWGHVCDGSAEFRLPPGHYQYEIEKGPHWTVVANRFVLIPESDTPQAPFQINARLRQFVDLSEESWYGGDLHVHRPLADIPLIMQAEDLQIASVQTWWNEQNQWLGNALTEPPLHRVGGNRVFHRLSGEDERGGGALLFHRMDKPMDITGSAREWPPSTEFQAEASKLGAWIEIEKPFWWDTPIWLANGGVDSIGIAHNHMNRRGILPGEAWGRPRDSNQYPGPHGNGLFTQDLYYRILNCGFRIPPSAGSASGVLANPVGYNRVYAHVEGEFGWDAWWDSFRAGHVFVSNGPLLRLEANGRLPGETLQFGEGPGLVRIEGRLDSRDPIESIELVANGRVEKISIPGEIEVVESGWFLVRAIAAPEDTFRFASTGPWYVQVGGTPHRTRRSDAKFFLDWAQERRGRVADAMNGDPRLVEVLAPFEKSIRFWQDKVSASTND